MQKTNTTEIKLIHEDVPGVTETFVDSVYSVMGGDGIVRLELCTTRLDEPQPPAPLTGRRATAARLVMPSTTATELIALLSQHLGPQQQKSPATQPNPAAAKH
jgi:hypothetical protein